jgi:U3 small nucleolar RNA-associated protein 21
MASAADHELPPRKRVRQENNTETEPHTQKTKECRLFAPFRAIGLVTNHVQFVLQTRSFKGATDGPRVHILTCLGRSWAMWEGEKMTLLFVGA